MPDLIGILSTVVLVSTVCTLMFAVLAYAVARRRRLLVGRDAQEELEAIQNEELHPLPQEAAKPARSAAPDDAADPFAMEQPAGHAFRAYRPDQAEAVANETVDNGELDLKWQ